MNGANHKITTRRAIASREAAVHNLPGSPFVTVSKQLSFLTLLMVILYLLLLYYFCYTSSASAPHPVPRMLAVTALVLASTSPMWFRYRDVGVFHPLYVSSAYILLKSTIPNARSWADGLDYHGAVPGMSPSSVAMLQVQVMLLNALSWICTIIGYHFAKGISWKAIRFYDRKRPLVFGAILAAVIGFGSMYLLIELSGGFPEHLKNITRGHSSRVYVGDAEWASIYAVLSQLTIVAPAIWILKGKNPFRNPLLWLLVIGTVGSGYLVNGRRSALLMRVIVLTACWILRQRKLALGRLALIGFALFAMVGIAGEFRRSNWKKGQDVSFEALTDLTIEDSISKSLEELEARRDSGAIYPIVARVPADTPYLLGENYFNYINRFIPRFIWKDKPRGIGMDCARIFYGRIDSGGIPPGSLGEAYWSGGVIGIVIVFLIWGAMLKSFGNFFVRHRHSAIACLVYLATVTTLGPSEPQFRAWLYLIAPTVIVLTAAGLIKFGKPSRRAV